MKEKAPLRATDTVTEGNVLFEGDGKRVVEAVVTVDTDTRPENDWGQRMTSGRTDDFESVVTHCADLWRESQGR